MGLFELGEFTLNSGEQSNYKIECDALCDGDWECLAELLLARLPKFGSVEGIPRGGLKLASILDKSATKNPADPILIADDVYTTGGSFRRAIEGRDGVFIGAVVFARNPLQEMDQWIVPLFTMNPKPLKPKGIQVK